MRAVLLYVELKRDLEYCEREVRYLVSKLPAGCQKVMHGKRQIGILIPPYHILPKIHAPLYKALEPFENYWLIGLSGEIYAKNGQMDPLADRIKEFSVPVVRRREPPKAQYMLHGQPRKPGR